MLFDWVLKSMFHLEKKNSNNNSNKAKRKDLSFLSFNFFFNCYLAVPRPTLGHSRGDSLTNPMSITAFSTISIRRSPKAS